eukprot:TRINITY_DN5557_c1_g1_i1.p1 TRINITY_DN5557_c1_g1~~TRINITY_DN5557_c1_g1_i1.p1  ORF type:complete len:200 (+),score=32.59 TRINITY_DN5557_c1_g1_i1:23-601(+)
MARPWHTNWKNLKLTTPKTSLIQGGVRKVHSTYNGSVELVEEYDVITDKLQTRKWRVDTRLGGEGKWEVEVGSEPPIGNELLVAAASTPLLSRVDTSTVFEWRVRNLPYPREVYSLTIDAPSEITIRTTNKKYFKKILVPDMLRGGLALEQSSLSWTHAHNTLVVSYVKPKQILQEEAAAADERKKMKSIRT